MNWMAFWKAAEAGNLGKMQRMTDNELRRERLGKIAANMQDHDVRRIDILWQQAEKLLQLYCQMVNENIKLKNEVQRYLQLKHMLPQISQNSLMRYGETDRMNIILCGIQNYTFGWVEAKDFRAIEEHLLVARMRSRITQDGLKTCIGKLMENYQIIECETGYIRTLYQCIREFDSRRLALRQDEIEKLEKLKKSVQEWIVEEDGTINPKYFADMEKQIRRFSEVGVEWEI